jgi:hypothetical protein
MLFSCSIAVQFTEHSVYLHTSNSNDIYNPVPFANEAYTFQRKLWKNRDLTVSPAITYIHLCGRLHASRFSYISTRPSRI